MSSLPEGYTVTISFDGDDKPCYAELRDSSMGIHVCEALWEEQLAMWYDPSGHAPEGIEPSADPETDAIEVCATLKRWLEERDLRGDTPHTFKKEA